jgi:GT2 family glycosyltransferase
MQLASPVGESSNGRAQIDRTLPRDRTENVVIIIPVHNGGAAFRRCLESVARAEPKPSSVVVGAAGNADDSWRVAEEFGVRIIRRSEAGGPAVARNVGARAVRKDDILFFVDADVTIHQNAIGQVADFFKHNPTVAAMIGSYDDKPTQPNFLSQYKNLLHHYTHQTAQEEASTFWGACGAIRSEIFHAMGGFDESYPRPSIEDVELGYRIKQRGHQIRLNKTLLVTHLKCWRIHSLLKADFFQRALPWTKLIHRDRKCINDLNLKHSARMSVLLTYGALITTLASLWSSKFLPVAAFCAIALLLLNAPLYRFFQNKRGPWFALRGMLWHVFYYFYSGLAFMVGTISYWFGRRFKVTQPTNARTLPDSLPFEGLSSVSVTTKL